MTIKSENCKAVDIAVYQGHVITKDCVEVDIARTEKYDPFANHEV